MLTGITSIRKVVEQVGQRVRVLERVRRVRVVEAAAVGAELLDHFLARDRTAGDGLRLADHRGDLVPAGEVLHDAHRHQRQRPDDRRSGAGPAARSGSGRPRSCRAGRSCSGRSRGSPPWRRRCRRPPRRSSVRRGRRSGPGGPSPPRGRTFCQFVFETNDAAVLNASAGLDAGQTVGQRQVRPGAAATRTERRRRGRRTRARSGRTTAQVCSAVAVDPEQLVGTALDPQVPGRTCRLQAM